MKAINITSYRTKMQNRLNSDLQRCREYLTLCFTNHFRDSANKKEWWYQYEQTREEIRSIEALLKRI